MKKWTKEQIEYLKKISNGKYNQEIADLINIKFGTTYTKCAINSQKRKHNIKSTMDWKTKYTQEVLNFMIENYQGKDNIELANLVNEKFNLNTNGDKICMLKANLIRRYGINLRTGINRGCYKKGNVPVNKGTKGVFNVGGNRTSFKKGNIPQNHREVGSRRVNIYGYHEIKIADYDEYYATGSRYSAFLKDLVDSLNGISAVLEVYVNHKGIHPGYAIEKLENSKSYINATINFFEYQIEKTEAEQE